MAMDKLREFESIFYPKSVAVIGASANEHKFGSRYLESKMLENIGERGGICYALPDHAALVFASLARYAEYLSESNLGTEANPRCTGR